MTAFYDFYGPENLLKIANLLCIFNHWQKSANVKILILLNHKYPSTTKKT